MRVQASWLLGLADCLLSRWRRACLAACRNATQAIMRAWLAELFLEEHKAKAFASLSERMVVSTSARPLGELLRILRAARLGRAERHHRDAASRLACCTGMLPSILGLIALSRLPETVKRKGSSSSTTRAVVSSSSSIELEEAPAVGKAGDVDA